MYLDLGKIIFPLFYFERKFIGFVLFDFHLDVLRGDLFNILILFPFMFSKTNEFAVQSGVAFVGLVVEESFNKSFG